MFLRKRKDVRVTLCSVIVHTCQVVFFCCARFVFQRGRFGSCKDMFEMLPFPVVSDDGCCPSLSRRFLEGSRKGEGGVFLPEPTLLESSPGGSHQGARGAHFFLLFSLSKKELIFRLTLVTARGDPTLKRP